jgi:hypothetical protein
MSTVRHFWCMHNGLSPALARVMRESKKGTLQGEVSTFGLDWLPDLYLLRTLRSEVLPSIPETKSEQE